MTDLAADSAQLNSTEPISVRSSRLRSAADTALNLAARFWFLVAVIGQWIFVTYVAVFYGGAALRGDWEAWNQVMAHAYVRGHTVGNLAIALHLLMAVAIIIGGPLQLIPQLRRVAPAFHRWNGRVYMLAVFVTSIAGLYMVWFRKSAGDFVQHLGITLDAILIMTFAVLALRHALVRDLKTHRRWALRLFIVANGVWFFRVGLMLWVFLNKGPAGFDPKTFTGPFLSFISFGSYLVPLAVLEVYLRVRERGSAPGRLAMAAGLTVLTVAMGIGIFMATMGMWLPRM